MNLDHCAQCGAELQEDNTSGKCSDFPYCEPLDIGDWPKD